MSAERPLAVLGATGYTGRLVVELARELGLPLRLVGRRREELERLASAGEEIRVADARHEAELIDAFDGAFAVASMAGPFLDVGAKPVGAAITVGAHYLDVSGEQAFARLVYEGFGESAEERDVVLLTSFGFDYVPGDLAARLAAEGLEPLDEIAVAYSVANMRSTRGTRRTVMRALRAGGFAATTRRMTFPFGTRDVVEWGGTEPLTVPRHTRVAEVHSYVRAPQVAARLVAPLRFVAPLIRPFALLRGDPPEEKRRAARFTVVAEASGPSGSRRVTLEGCDPYGLTARLIVRGAQALMAGEVPGAGALAPAEAFDARAFIERLTPFVVVVRDGT